MADLAAIQRTLTEQGPLTGADLHAAIGGEVFGLWKTCRSSGQLVLRTIGHRYLRLDRTVEGFARLSPSILREFMTYTVVGAPAQAAAIEQAAEQLRSRTLAISRAKHRVAERFVAEVFDSVVPEGGDGHHLCALIAGDVVYEMSHDVSRRESSTGGRVDGSDLDLIILASDDAPDELIEASKLDGAGPFRFFKDTVLPLSATNIAALFVILFIYGWNQYLWPLLITTRDDMQTIVIGIKKMIVTADALTEWNVVLATAMLAMLPPVMVVVLMQRWFVKGLVETEK